LTTKLVMISIIALFFGVVITPNIIAEMEQIPESKEHVDITVELYGLSGKSSHTLSFLKENAERLNSLIAEIHARIDTTTSKNETEDVCT
jgi:hypothetical protein